MKEQHINGNGTSSSKKINRNRSFHFRYLEMCRAKHFPPVADVKFKNNVTTSLDFFGDKLRVDDWLLIIEALHYDQILQQVSIRLRKNVGRVVEHIDTEKKAKIFRQKPAIYTKCVFRGIVNAVCNCIQFNKNLAILQLEALPLNEFYLSSIAKALSNNEHLRQISFQRSPIGDAGCETICSTLKHLVNVHTVNLTECNLSAVSAGFISDMIKFQKICRYSEGWERSLRYRDLDPNEMPGLRVLSLSKNPLLCDEGIRLLVEVLKDDAWIKVIDAEECGITDIGANNILDCLELNNTIVEFNIRNNAEVSKFLIKNIRQQLGKDDDEVCESDVNLRKSIGSLSHLKERLKCLEDQIASEKHLRKQVEILNEKLHHQILFYQKQLGTASNNEIPDGYVLVKNESLESIINERNELFEAASKTNKAKTSLKKIIKVRRVKSEVKYKQMNSTKKMTESDFEFVGAAKNEYRNVIFEKDIGDTGLTSQQQQQKNVVTQIEQSSKKPLGIDPDGDHSESSESHECQETSEQIKVFVRKRQNSVANLATAAASECLSPRTLFLGRCH